MAFLLRYLNGEVTQCGNDLLWRDAAREARRCNAAAQSQGRPERYLVDSESLVACVIARDKPVWSNRLLLDTLGPAPASILDVVHPSCREVASKCVGSMNVATLPRSPIRLLYRSEGEPVAIVWSVVDQWMAGGEVYQASVGSVIAKIAFGRDYSLVTCEHGKRVVTGGLFHCEADAMAARCRFFGIHATVALTNSLRDLDGKV